MMPLQRARGAESRARNKLSNGPLRAQSKTSVKYSATCGHTSVAGGMLVSRQAHGCSGREPGWHRGLYRFVLGRKYISVKDVFIYPPLAVNIKEQKECFLYVYIFKTMANLNMPSYQ